MILLPSQESALEEGSMVATFSYEAPTTVRDALEALGRLGEDAKILAGGQSLLPLINLGLAQPSALIDITGIADLEYIRETDGQILIGAMTRYATALSSDIVQRRCPLLGEALRLIGDRQIRNRGTIGGSIAHADPVAELPTVATCLDAVMHIEGAAGGRDLSAADFFITYLTTAIGPGELLTEIRFPILPARTGVAFQELVRRKGDFAIVAAAATARIGDGGRCEDVKLALAGAAPTPVRARAAEALLSGAPPTDENIRVAARAACEGIDPEADIMASAEYRRAMVEVHARRALEQAVRSAGGQESEVQSHDG